LLREKRAGVLLDMGKLEDAEQELDRALALEAAAWGEDNARVLQGRMLRVNLRRKQGRLDDALDEAREVAELQAEVLGPEDLKTLITRGTVAVLVGQTAGFEEAIPMMKAVVEDMVAVAGSGHPSTLSLRNNYGVMLMQTKRYGQVQEVLTQLIADKRAALGPTHRSVLDTWVGVAGALGAKGDLDAAMQEYALAIDTFEASLPDSDPSMAWARREFGEFLGAFDRAQEATEQFEKAWAYFGQPEVAPAERARLAYNLAMAYVGVDEEALQRWYAVAEAAHEDGALPDWEWKNLRYRITRTGDAPPSRAK